MTRTVPANRLAEKCNYEFEGQFWCPKLEMFFPRQCEEEKETCNPLKREGLCRQSHLVQSVKPQMVIDGDARDQENVETLLDH